MKRVYRTTITLEIITHGKPVPSVKQAEIHLLQSPGPLADLLNHDSDSMDPHIVGMKFGKPVALSKAESGHYTGEGES